MIISHKLNFHTKKFNLCLLFIYGHIIYFLKNLEENQIYSNNTKSRIRTNIQFVTSFVVLNKTFPIINCFNCGKYFMKIKSVKFKTMSAYISKTSLCYFIYSKNEKKSLICANIDLIYFSKYLVLPYLTNHLSGNCEIYISFVCSLGLTTKQMNCVLVVASRRYFVNILSFQQCKTLAKKKK